MLNKFIRFVMIYIALIGIGIFVTALIIMPGMSYSDKWIPKVFLIIGFVIFIAALFSVIKINKRIKTYRDKQKQLNLAINQNISNSEGFLTVWKYNQEEWSFFLKKEMIRKRNDLFLISFLIILLGTPLLIFARNASIEAAIAVSAVLALIYSIISYYHNISRYTTKINDSYQVVFFKDYLLINGKLTVLNDDKINLFSVEFNEIKGLKTLEFKIF